MKRRSTLNWLALSLATLIALVARAYAPPWQTNSAQTNVAPPNPPVAAGGWLTLTNDLRARLVILEDASVSTHSSLMAGLEFQRTSNSPAFLYFNYDPVSSVDWSLLYPNGKSLPPSFRYSDGPRPEAGWLALPADSVLRFRAATLNPTPPASGRMMVAGLIGWEFPDGDTNDYFLSATLNLNVTRSIVSFPPGGVAGHFPPPVPVWQGAIELPPVKLPPGKTP